MKPSQLGKASKLLDQIKVLDAQIIEIDKLAMLCANGKLTSSSFELKVEEEQPQGSKVGFDEDGSLITDIRNPITDWRETFMTGYMVFSQPSPKHTMPTCTIGAQLSENETLQFLGFLLRLKHDQRKVLIEQLESYGVK